MKIYGVGEAAEVGESTEVGMGLVTDFVGLAAAVGSGLSVGVGSCGTEYVGVGVGDSVEVCVPRR